MTYSKLPFCPRPGTDPSSHAAVPAPRRSRRLATFRYGLLTVVLILPAVAWASGSEPAPAPGDSGSDRPPRARSRRLAADEQIAQGLLPARHASGWDGTIGAIVARRAALPARSPAASATAQVSPHRAPARRAALPARSLPVPTARTAQRDAPSSGPDFLFGRPRMSFGLRGLWHRARAGSDFHDFVNDQLFVPRSDGDDHDNPDHGLLNFNAPGISFDFGYGVTSRLDMRVGVDYAMSLNESELRHYIGQDGQSFRQRTELSQTDVRGELVLALAPRGRAIGQYVWIPGRVVPYVGAGLGFVRHNLQQAGEFVDEIGYFEDTFGSKGWGTGMHLFGGVDIRITRHAILNVEVRHVEAGADLSDDFAGFDPVDLGGLRIGAGVRFVF